MHTPSPWPWWVVSREPRSARGTLVLCGVAFGMVLAARTTTDARGMWFELVLASAFLLWAAAQWAFVEARRRRERAFRREVEQYLRGRSEAPHGD